LGVIETRDQRLHFVSNLYDIFKYGILRDCADQTRAIKINPGVASMTKEEQSKDTFFVLADLAKTLE